MIYFSNQNPEDGQSIEVFTKDSKESLKDAIDRVFLNGLSPDLCYFQNVENTFGYPSTFSLGLIGYSASEIPVHCPKAYSKSN